MPTSQKNFVLSVLFSITLMGDALAGAQKHEDLEGMSDSVRSVIRASLVLEGPLEIIPEHKDAFNRWREKVQPLLVEFLKRRARGASQAEVPRHELDGKALQNHFLQAVWYESKRTGFDPSLILGLIEVESGFRQFAISSAGAQGYMQVMPFWAKELAGSKGDELFRLQANIRYGCVILRSYLEQAGGNIRLALTKYNGSKYKIGGYADNVLFAQKKWIVE